MSLGHGRPNLLLLGEGAGLPAAEGLVLSAARESVPPSFVVRLEGRTIRDSHGFFSALKVALPSVSYMGEGLDALEDVLRVEAVPRDQDVRAYWVWVDCHELFTRDSVAFTRLFHSMAWCARQINDGGENGQPVGVNARDSKRQPRVSLCLIGAWSAFSAVATHETGFLYRFAKPFSDWYPDGETQLTAIKIDVSV